MQFIEAFCQQGSCLIYATEELLCVLELKLHIVIVYLPYRLTLHHGTEALGIGVGVRTKWPCPYTSKYHF